MSDNIENKSWQMYASRMRGVISDDVAKHRFASFTSRDFAQPLSELVSGYITKGQKVLDVGSGFGSFVYLLKKKGVDVTGIELNSAQTEFSRLRLINERIVTSSESDLVYVNGSALNLPFEDETFDVITLWDVLEHIENYELALAETYRVLKKGGRLFVRNVNYAATFVEPHYRVFWIPHLSKKVGGLYLRLLGRNIDYFSDSIFLINHSMICIALKKMGFTISNNTVEKINTKNPVIKSRIKQGIYNIVEKLNLKAFLIKVLLCMLKNPLIRYTDVIAIK